MQILKIKTRRRRIGDFGERAARRYLWLHGYFVLAKNYVANGHEIDIIARRGRTLVFCEVKTRALKSVGGMEVTAASAVTPEKQRKIFSAANFFKGYKYRNFKMRFDVIEVYYENENRRDRVKRINHMLGAFDKDTAYGMPKERYN